MINIYILSFIMYIDYLLTYLGIKFNVIYEGNPLLINLFNYDFILGSIMRLISITIIMILIYYLYKKSKKHFNYVIYSAYFINLFIFILHLNWIKKI